MWIKLKMERSEVSVLTDLWIILSMGRTQVIVIPWLIGHSNSEQPRRHDEQPRRQDVTVLTNIESNLWAGQLVRLCFVQWSGCLWVKQQSVLFSTIIRMSVNQATMNVVLYNNQDVHESSNIECYFVQWSGCLWVKRQLGVVLYSDQDVCEPSNSWV